MTVQILVCVIIKSVINFLMTFVYYKNIVNLSALMMREFKRQLYKKTGFAILLAYVGHTIVYNGFGYFWLISNLEEAHNPYPSTWKYFGAVVMYEYGVIVAITVMIYEFIEQFIINPRKKIQAEYDMYKGVTFADLIDSRVVVKSEFFISTSLDNGS